jgi:hypothetical protein
MEGFAPMRLSARIFKPTVFSILISFPAKDIRKKLISMMGLAYDLYHGNLRLTFFEKVSRIGR